MDTSDNYLEIPVTYKREELSFAAKMMMSGFTHKIQVEVNGQEFMFEPDEERNYRAILSEEQLQKNTKVDVGLLQAIAQVLESVAR